MKNLKEEIDSSIARIEQREKDVITEIKKLEKKVSKYNNWAWFFVILGGIIGIGASFIFFCIKGFCFCDFELNLLGDFLAGSMGAIWSLAGLFFIYVAFLGQKQQLLNQQLEIMYNQLELKYTRHELAGQQQEMKNQNKTLKIQNFENTFFSLLNLLSKIIDSISIKNERSQEIISSSRGSFSLFYNELISIINKNIDDEIVTVKNLEVSTILDSYNELYEKNKKNKDDYTEFYTELTTKFKKYQNNDDSQHQAIKVSMSSYQKLYDENATKSADFYKIYGDLVKIMNKKYDNDNYDIENINIDSLIKSYDKLYNKNQSDLGHYFRSIYHIIKFIDKSDIEDKKNYIGFLRAQLSSYEQIIIFYNCLHPYGKKLKILAEKYSLFKSIDVNLFINTEHKGEFKNTAYEYESITVA